MLARERPAECQRPVENGLDGCLHPPPLFPVAPVRENRRMQIAVPGVAEGPNGQMEFGGNLFDRPDHRRDLAPWNGSIFQNRGGLDARKGGERSPPSLPHLVPLGGILGHPDAHGSHPATERFDHCGILRHLHRVAVDFHEQQRRGVGGKPHPAEGLYRPNGEVVQKLESHRHNTPGNDCCNRFRGFVDIVENGHERPAGGRPGDEFKGDPGKYPQRAFRTHQQPTQIVP